MPFSSTNHINYDKSAVQEAFFAWQIAISLFRQTRIGIIPSKSDGSITQCNDKVCSILGFSEEELCGIGWKTLTHPDDLSLDEKMLDKSQDGAIKGYSLLKRYMTKAGDYKPVVITPYKVAALCKNNFYVTIVEESNEPFVSAKVLMEN